jgi:hypothetical protein
MGDSCCRQAAEELKKVRGNEGHVIELGKLFPFFILCDSDPYDLAPFFKTRKGLPLALFVG